MGGASNHQYLDAGGHKPWMHRLTGVWKSRTDLLPANVEAQLPTQQEEEDDEEVLPPEVPTKKEAQQDNSGDEPNTTRRGSKRGYEYKQPIPLLATTTSTKYRVARSRELG